MWKIYNSQLDMENLIKNIYDVYIILKSIFYNVFDAPKSEKSSHSDKDISKF